MIIDQWISVLSVLGIYILILGSAFAAFEGGFRLGIRRLKHRHKERHSPVSPMVAATLGLLAFMLSFSFGIAGSHFDTRRQLVVDEANSVRSSYYLAGFLSKEAAVQSRNLIRQYLDLRLGKMKSFDDLPKIIASSNEIQCQLWDIAKTEEEKGTGVNSSWLYAQSLTDMFSVQTRRIVYGTQRRIPLAIWIVLWGITVLGMASTGYQAGIAGVRGFFVYMVLIVTFSMVIILVYDLDQPRPILFKVNQDAMTDLQQQMHAQIGLPR